MEIAGIAGIVFKGTNLFNAFLKEVHSCIQHLPGTKNGEMLEHNDEFQRTQSFKRLTGTLHICVTKGLNATVRSLTHIALNYSIQSATICLL